jgi:Asp-tRNA(Asn)/Glu-tRNA(Gln) amidotransferase A subunit family amidase
MRDALAAAIDRLHADGATVADLDVDLRAATADHRTVMAAEAATTVPELPGLGENLVALVAEGHAVPDGELTAARERSAATRETVLARLADADAVLAPGALGVAPPGLDATGDPVLSRPWHVMGLPALAVPGLRDADGLPLGLQLIGHPDREDALLAAGRRLESLLP